MSSLPAIAISDATLVRLAEVLATPDDAERIKLLATALTEDAQFNATVQQAAQRAGRKSFATPDQLAAWLWEVGLPPAALRDSSAAIDRAQELYEKLRANYLQRELAVEQRLLREKLASLKEFAYGASHELNNPLFNISSRAQLLLRDECDPERRRKLATIHAHALRASEMINDMALAAKPPRPTMAPIELRSLVEAVAAELAPAAAESGVTIVVGEKNIGAVNFSGDAVQLSVAIREVCLNACEALRRAARAGVIEISLRAGDEHVEVAISDNGPSLDARSRRHLFDPFFSGYESGRGLGFGLTKCWQIVDAHGGEVLIDSEAGTGATFTLRFPWPKSA